jgi:hypothetical protein
MHSREGWQKTTIASLALVALLFAIFLLLNPTVFSHPNTSSTRLRFF